MMVKTFGEDLNVLNIVRKSSNLDLEWTWDAQLGVVYCIWTV